jgi:hypothetical protein
MATVVLAPFNFYGRAQKGAAFSNNKQTLDSLNEILNPVNVRTTSNTEDASEGN